MYISKKKEKKEGINKKKTIFNYLWHFFFSFVFKNKNSNRSAISVHVEDIFS